MDNLRVSTPDRETPLRAEQLRTTLQARVLGRSGLLGSQNFRAVFLTSGKAELTGAGGSMISAAPCLIWVPWTDAMRLTIAPGSAGYHLSTGPAILSLALRHNPNAAELGYMIERRYRVDLAQDPACEATLAACFAGLMTETSETGAMSANLVEAHLSVLLITLYRRLRASHVDMSFVGGIAPLASRFVALIEAHLHERWSVADFCKALDVSRDQLHATCLRSYQRSPGLLIRQRTVLEARRLLEQSTMTVDQIALRLGFSGGAQFNRFFSTIEGVPPGRFRKQIQMISRERAGPAIDLAAWP